MGRLVYTSNFRFDGKVVIIDGMVHKDIISLECSQETDFATHFTQLTRDAKGEVLLNSAGDDLATVDTVVVIKKSADHSEPHQQT